MKKIPIILLLLLIPSISHAWLAGYSNRIPFNVTGTASGAQTNYQLPLTVYQGGSAVSAQSENINTGYYFYMGAPYVTTTVYCQNKYWQFYTNPLVNEHYLRWKTSADAKTWSAEQTKDISPYHLFGCDFLSVVSDGTYIHIVICDFVYESRNESTRYIRGLANNDSTITWDSIQLVKSAQSGYYARDPDIELDSNGYPWIAYNYTHYLGEGSWEGVGHVVKSSSKDGTWTEEFNQVINATPFPSEYEPSAWCSIAVMTGGKMYAIVGPDHGVGPIRGRLYNAGWGAEHDVTNPAQDAYGAAMSLTSNGDLVYLVYAIDGVGYYYTKYQTSWSTAINTGAGGLPGMNLDANGDSVVVWLAVVNGLNKVQYRRIKNGVVSATQTLALEPDAFAFTGAVCMSPCFSTGKNLVFWNGNAADPTDLMVATYPPTRVGLAANEALTHPLQIDFDDVRVTDTSDTAVDYAVMNKLESDTAKVWIEFPNTPANGASTGYYLYYNNPSATSGSNLTNTFLFGDDFEGTLSKWSQTKTGSGTCTIDTAQKKFGASSGKNYAPAASYAQIQSGGSSTAHRLQFYFRSNGASCYNDIHDTIITTAHVSIAVLGTDLKYTSNGSTWTTIQTCAADTWYKADLITKTGSVFDLYINDVSKLSNANQYTVTWGGPYQRFAATATGSFWVDDVIMSKWVTPEPIINGVGSEETAPVTKPKINITTMGF